MRPGTLLAKGLGKAFRKPSQMSRKLWRTLRSAELSGVQWVIRGIDVSLSPGQSLGVIGDNGAGKTTLLKLLAGALLPTEGELQHHGRRAVMLQLGGGFHPELSGRENLRIGCAVIGLSAVETTALMPEIIEFSELEGFMDQPLRTLSSGMQLRLGFALATAVTPDLLIVDEHLSVGDQHFQRKCIRRILDLKAAGCTLVICSHTAFLMNEICDEVLWLHEGIPKLSGRPGDVLAAYDDHVRERDGRHVATPVGAHVPASEPIADVSRCAVLKVELLGDVLNGMVFNGQQLIVHVEALIPAAFWRHGVDLGLLLSRNDGLKCAALTTRHLPATSVWIPLGADVYRARCIIADLPLLAGRYDFSVGLLESGSPLVLAQVHRAAVFEVRSSGWDVALMRIEHSWSTQDDNDSAT
jgi:lipopolysaccharide transport system ATP-binding protein